MAKPKHSAGSDALAAFLARAHEVRRRKQMALSTLSLRVFSDSRRLEQIIAGGDIGVRKIDRAMTALDQVEAAELVGRTATKR